jgi:hypothetical protein
MYAQQNIDDIESVYFSALSSIDSLTKGRTSFNVHYYNPGSTYGRLNYQAP